MLLAWLQGECHAEVTQGPPRRGRSREVVRRARACMRHPSARMNSGDNLSFRMSEVGHAVGMIVQMCTEEL